MRKRHATRAKEYQNKRIQNYNLQSYHQQKHSELRATEIAKKKIGKKRNTRRKAARARGAFRAYFSCFFVFVVPMFSIPVPAARQQLQRTQSGS